MAHVARCVCRRAERLAVHLHEQSPVEPILLQYLNRLSYWLFVFSREMTRRSGAEEVALGALAVAAATYVALALVVDRASGVEGDLGDTLGADAERAVLSGIEADSVGSTALRAGAGPAEGVGLAALGQRFGG